MCASVFGSSCMTKPECLCYFLPVCLRLNSIKSCKPLLQKDVDCNIVGKHYDAVQYIMLLQTVLQWQRQNINQTWNSQKTLHHVQSMGCLLWASGKNYIVIIPSNCKWKFVKHNSLRPNDASVSYIIIGWDNGFSLARRQAIILTNCTVDVLPFWPVEQTGEARILKLQLLIKTILIHIEMSSAKCRLFGLGLSAWLVDMIWRRCRYYALCCYVL